MTKYQTAATLLELMYQANSADTEHAEEWQTPDMAQGLFADLAAACRKVLGNELYDYIMGGDIFLTAQELERVEKELKREEA
jgi:hypothetical protein